MAWYDTLKDNITTIFTDPEKQMPLPATSLMTNAELIDAGGREGTGLNYGNLTQPQFPVDYSLPYTDTSNYGMGGDVTSSSLFDDSNWWNDDVDLTYDGGFTDTADKRFKQNADNLAAIAASNSNSTNRNPTYNPTGGGGGGGGASAYSAPQAEAAYLSQDLSQRTPSGTQYAPDMSAYNDSSLFNYTGPGGVDGYTYGQGLRTDGADYSVFGTPTDMVNPYYEGQFSDPVPTGPADSAVNMSPIVMPEGIPAIGGGSGTTFITPRPPSSAGDLTYQQTIDEMGIFGPNNPPPSTLFPSPGGANTPANMGLTERQIAQMSPQQQAYMTQTLADQNRMQQGQLGSGTAPVMNDTSGNYGLTMPDMGNNYGVGERFGSDSIQTLAGQDFYDTVNGGEWEAQQNFNKTPMGNGDLGSFSIYDNNFDLGRPGDPSYQEFVADPSKFTTNQRPDYSLQSQEIADQLMAGLTSEELRDGLFMEPQLKVVDGKLTGKMGIPDIFTQDKTPTEARDASLFDSGFEFDSENPYAEQGMTDGFLWQDNDGNYHKQWDDMGLIDIIPGMNDPEFLRGDALTEFRNQSLAAEQAKQNKIADDANKVRAEKAQREQEIYLKEQMAAREEVVQRNIAEARALAEEQARVAADRKVFRDRIAAKVPVYTAPTPAPRPTAPAGGYSTKSLNNNFSTRRDVRNLFA